MSGWLLTGLLIFGVVMILRGLTQRHRDPALPRQRRQPLTQPGTAGRVVVNTLIVMATVIIAPIILINVVLSLLTTGVSP